jgi:hypothetical protein
MIGAKRDRILVNPTFQGRSMDQHVQKYIDAFGDPSSESGAYRKDSRLAKAYEVALDIRKFEIELYWKRSASFWLLVGGIAAALGLLLSGKSDAATGAILSSRGKELACFLLCSSGAVICYAWKLVNQGSKFWQRNWEYQVGILEQQVVGPLYKTVMSSSEDKVMYSVSKINGNISGYLSVVFVIAALALLIGQDGKDQLIGAFGNRINPGALGFGIKLVIATAHLWFFWKLKRTGKNRTLKKAFDNKIEVSVRDIMIERAPYGSDDALKIWDSPAPQAKAAASGAAAALQNLLRSIKNLASSKA